MYYKEAIELIEMVCVTFKAGEQSVTSLFYMIL